MKSLLFHSHGYDQVLIDPDRDTLVAAMNEAVQVANSSFRNRLARALELNQVFQSQSGRVETNIGRHRGTSKWCSRVACAWHTDWSFRLHVRVVGMRFPGRYSVWGARRAARTASDAQLVYPNLFTRLVNLRPSDHATASIIDGWATLNGDEQIPDDCRRLADRMAQINARDPDLVQLRLASPGDLLRGFRNQRGDCPFWIPRVATHEQAVDMLTHAVEKFGAEELQEFYEEVFPDDPYSLEDAYDDVSPLIERLVTHINSGLEIEEIALLWESALSEYTVLRTDERDRINYAEATEITQCAR